VRVLLKTGSRYESVNVEHNFIAAGRLRHTGTCRERRQQQQQQQQQQQPL
jgi:hypothetical protein